jgi:hypothetical protein
MYWIGCVHCKSVFNVYNIDIALMSLEQQDPEFGGRLIKEFKSARAKEPGLGGLPDLFYIQHKTFFEDVGGYKEANWRNGCHALVASQEKDGKS